MPDFLRWCRDGVDRVVMRDNWMRLEVLRQYPPGPARWDRVPAPTLSVSRLPRIGVVTPSFQQAGFLAATLDSVTSQSYPRLAYFVQDGASIDGSIDIIRSSESRLAGWRSEPDRGQADAILRGFAALEAELAATDLMAWLNSDDLYAPGALRRVGEYLARHPDVDAVYGHRLIVDESGGEIGRWILPRHDPRVLEWVDYVPQETLFWRKRLWDRVGGLDPSFQFALDWDLLARFTAAGARIVRLPWVLAAFRVHAAQKTSSQLHSRGAEEMDRIRERIHGPGAATDWTTINRWAHRAKWQGGLASRLLDLGIRR